MSVSRMPVIHGSVVVTASTAMVPSKTSGRPPRPCARKMSAITHTVSADCTMTAGQKSGRASNARNRP